MTNGSNGVVGRIGRSHRLVDDGCVHGHTTHKISALGGSVIGDR